MITLCIACQHKTPIFNIYLFPVTKVEQTFDYQTTNTFGQQKRDPGHKRKKPLQTPINIDVTFVAALLLF